MITRDSIIEYFDNEAEASLKSWESLMALPLKERIRKRKAIDGLKVVENGFGISPENESLIKLSYTRNLSDFKEGDYLVLHKEGQKSGMECSLYEYNEDNVLTISVFPPKQIYRNEELSENSWILDKAYTDLRQNVFSNFYYGLPSDKEYWNKSIVNTPTAPVFEDIMMIEEELDDTIKNFEFSFTTKQREAIVNSMAAKDYYLIQGPPGTGKSFVLGVIILEEILYFKHKVIVIGPNHMAINNALGQVIKIIPFWHDFVMKVGQSNNAPSIKVLNDKAEEVGIENIHHLNVQWINDFFEKYHEKAAGVVIGLTPHSLYTSRARGLECDTLIVDEAGQVTIPLGLMGMIKAKKVIFAGDHKQLPPIVTSDKTSDEMKQSIFQKIMREDNYTMLDTTFRMCGPICNFVSTLFYEGELKAKYKNESNRITCSDKLYSFNVPVVLLNVQDEGVQVSEREANAIVDIIKKYLNLGLSANEIGVLSPFRAQAAHIRRLLKKDESIGDENAKALAVDTIDKMQGQEREVIIFTMVAGDTDYMLEMADFLYNPNKLNVAFSRAKSKLIVVGNMIKLASIDTCAYPHIKQMLEYSKAEHIDYVL